jgi:thiol-disulfide isomerase/thioredoxin
MTLATLLLSSAMSVCAAVSWMSDPAAASAASAKSGKPVLVDFQAPWCYSCYYMEERVLSKPGFEKAAERFILLKLDVDTAEGAAEKARRAVTFLPSYLVVDAAGKELGRIIGEQTEADFLAKLDGFSGGKAAKEDKALTALRAKARKGDWSALEALLKKPADCETPYDVSFAAAAVDKLYPEHRDAVLKTERAVLEKLAEERLFSAPAARCADFRSGVETLADVHEKLGAADKRDAVLRRALAQLEKEGGPAGEDRSRDDNRRFLLEKLGDAAAVRSWYESLVKAYPSDYVYAFRYAKWLHKRAENEKALEWAGKADALSYGANRLAVTNLRAKLLAALGRKAEALAALDRDLKAAPKALKDQRAELEKTRKDLAR